MNKLLASILILLCTNVNAQWMDNKGKIVSQTNMKANGDFGASLLMVDLPEFQKEWKKPSEPVKINEKSTIKVGQQTTGLVLFSGCTVKNDVCNVSVDYVLHTPGNKPQQLPTQILFNGKPQSKGILSVGKAMLNVLAEPTDPVGIYKLQAHIKDNHSNKSLLLETKFEIIK